MDKEWCGLTILYHDKPGYEDTTNAWYVDTPVGLVRRHLTHEELENAKDVYDTWMSDMYELVLKPNQKELNAKYFNAAERKKFAETDRAEWRQ